MEKEEKITTLYSNEAFSPTKTNFAGDIPLEKQKLLVKRQRNCQTSSPVQAMQAFNNSKSSIKLDPKYFGSHSKVNLNDKIFNSLNQ